MAKDAFGDELPLVPDRTHDSARGVPPLRGAIPATPASEWSSSGPGPATTWTSGTGHAAARGSGAPVGLLGLAALLVVLSLVVAALADRRPAAAVLGWALGGFAAIGVLAWYTVVDARRRTDPWYDDQAWPDRLRTSLLLAAAVAVTVNALRFADWASRL